MPAKILSSCHSPRSFEPTLNRPPEDDALWRQQYEATLHSLSAFLVAESAHHQTLHNKAGEVIVFHGGCFKTIRELFDQQCASHTSDSLIYEVWAWETAQRVHALMPSLERPQARALKIYADRLGLYDVNESDTYEAIREAKFALEGDPWLEAH